MTDYMLNALFRFIFNLFPSFNVSVFTGMSLLYSYITVITRTFLRSLSVICTNKKMSYILFNKTISFCLSYSSYSSTCKKHIKMSNSLADPIPKKNKGGRPQNCIWEDITKGISVGSGKFAASCKYCDTTWPRGEVSRLEEHLSNHCQGAPAAVVRKYLTKVMERQDKTKKRKISSQQSTMDDYHDATELNESRCTRINRALVKFFIACGISFRIVEHPFFVNFIKELNAGYSPPTREFLANQLLERELAYVNNKMKSELQGENNLTLGLLNFITILI